jgi:hypothetical protein
LRTDITNHKETGHENHGKQIAQGIALLALASSIGLSLGLATRANADPTGGVIPLECDELGSVAIVIPGNGIATAPGLVVGSTQVGVPYAITLTGTFTPVGGEPEPILDAFERRAPAHDRLDHCTFHQEGANEFGSFVLDGDVFDLVHAVALADPTHRRAQPMGSASSLRYVRTPVTTPFATEKMWQTMLTCLPRSSVTVDNCSTMTSSPAR